MKPEPGTYQTTFRVEKWERKRKTPRVQYRTTFGGPVIDHNDILELVRELHAAEGGEAHALVEVFRKAKNWDTLASGIDGCMLLKADKISTLTVTSYLEMERKAEAYDELNPLIRTAYLTDNPGVKMNGLVRKMRQVIRTLEETETDP